MNVEEFREYCLQKQAVIECLPFDDTTLVFKVAGKMFALIALDSDQFNFSVKCDPEKAIELREQYPCVQPAWHFNKKHWNGVLVDGSLSDQILCSFIDHSYDLVVSGLSKKDKEAFFLIDNKTK
ncbi:MAG: MmcQ/YjbR family DNA-binding protein [Bacteroidota bacterium]